MEREILRSNVTAVAVASPIFQGEPGCKCIYSGLNQNCFIISFLLVTML